VLNFRGVHAVQTSTPALAEVLGRLNPEIGVFPNAIADVPEVRNFSADDRITLFFAGLNREQDWPPFLDAINAVATRFGERLHFEVINDRRLFEALATRRKNFTPLCDYKVYGDILARCEISFMPLADTAFNRCKSDLKFIEAGARGVLALASSVAYEDTIADGRTGILFRDARELEQRLTRLVNEPTLARVIGDAARRYVIDNRMLSYQVAERSAWYHALWERRDDLNRSLLARVPELGAA
jgi:glycosyltransferase involved in cell wall biosynthesis